MKVTSKMYILDLEPDETVNAVGSVQNLPLSSRSIDVVLCFNVLEHVSDGEGSLCKIKRVFRGGGTLYAFVPFLVPIHPDPDDYFRYTDEAVAQMLESTGFNSHSIIPLGGVLKVTLNLTQFL